MLIDIETGNALDVRGASTAPDTPIVALPMSGNTNQKWKYSVPKPFVSIRYNHVMDSNISPSNFTNANPALLPEPMDNAEKLLKHPTILFIDKASASP